MTASPSSSRIARSVLACAAAGLVLLAGGCQALDEPDAKAPPPSRPTTVIDGSNTGRAPAVVAEDPRPTRPRPAASEDGATSGTISPTGRTLTPAEAAVAQGTELVAEGRYAEALQAFDKAISDNPLLVSAYVGAGDALRAQGDYAAAEKRYAQACAIEPTNFDAQYNHGLTLQLLNRWPEAVSAYVRALAIKPGDFQANLNVATAYLQLSEPDQALPFAQRAAGIDPNSGAARNNLGRIYAAMDRHAEAIVEFRQAAELMQPTSPLLLNLANSLGKDNRHEESVNVLNQLIQTEPSPAAYERLGASLFKLRRYDASMAAFRTALEIDPNHFPALNGLGVCLLNQFEFTGQNDEVARREAVRALRRSLQLQPNQPAILNLVTRYQ